MTVADPEDGIILDEAEEDYMDAVEEIKGLSLLNSPCVDVNLKQIPF
jgi:hypothetical protein